MLPQNWNKYGAIASWGALVAVVIGFFQFLAVANVYFSIASSLIYMWLMPSAANNSRLGQDKEGGFISGAMSLCFAVMFLTTTPAIIVAWAFRLRDGYELQSLAMEAFVLSILLFITAISGLQATLAKKDINEIVYDDSEKDKFDA